MPDLSTDTSESRLKNTFASPNELSRMKEALRLPIRNKCIYWERAGGGTRGTATIGNWGLIENICARMQNICRLSAAGACSSLPVETMSFVLVLCLSGGESVMTGFFSVYLFAGLLESKASDL